MAKLAYYASRIAPDKPHQLETPEGYRIYTAVPICRSGFQEYLGKELKTHPDYNPEWNLADDEVVKVYRPKEVVTAPETIASFETKSVLDGHPPDDVAVVMVENESEYGRGHMQNVRGGPVLEDGEAKGEVSLLADLVVKNQPLNDKIDGGVRDVSCGYIYSLKRSDDGTLVMSRICGNHVAVVPKGRAGPEVSIRDAATTTAISEIRPTPEIRKEKRMNKNFWGRMLKLLAASDAAPEDLEKVAKQAKDEEAEEAKAKAKDAEPFEGKEDPAEERKEEVELHPELKQHIADMKACMDAVMQHLGLSKKEEGSEDAAGDADVLEMTGEEKGKTDLPKQIAGDSAEFLKAVKPLVAATKDKALIVAFNNQVRAEKAKKAAADADPYAALAHASDEDVSSALKGTSDDFDPSSFFNGRPYAEGKRLFDDYMAKKAGK